MYSNVEKISRSTLILGKAKDYMTLVKFRLTFLVAFSSAFGYILGSRGYFDWINFIMFSIGGFLISGSSVTINQIMEKEYDKLMSRTMNRPLPANRISVNEALLYAGILAILGFGILAVYTNLFTTTLALFSMLMYCFVYTPLKRVGPIAVFMGAIPGALPPLLGWIAATGAISYEAVIIFSIQFIWQFPHFWAIAWLADEDYKRAGFKLLPGAGKKDLNTAFQIMIYSLFLIPLGLLPAKIGLTGINSAMVAVVCGVLFLATTFSLMKEGNRKAALKIMYGSFLYLPIVQIAFLLDKI
jgi:heme o synthase